MNTKVYPYFNTVNKKKMFTKLRIEFGDHVTAINISVNVKKMHIIGFGFMELKILLLQEFIGTRIWITGIKKQYF
jgi:hypothetical protein